ncbi:MAG: guanylate kinase [Candidatus Kapaibacterium sp.]
MKNKNLLVLSAPSGGGKSTIAAELMKKFPKLKFSVSATTRGMRKGEKEGVNYYYLSNEDFENRINTNQFIESEEIFGNRYGTLKCVVDDAIINNNYLIFDIDVKGALSIKSHYPENSLLIFIAPPGMEALEHRLRSRSTETEEQIRTRIDRAELELSYQDKFDFVVINDELGKAVIETIEIVSENMDL